MSIRSGPVTDAGVMDDALNLDSRAAVGRGYLHVLSAVCVLLSCTALTTALLAQPDKEYLNASCAEVAGKFIASPQHADRLRNEFLLSYKGKWVRWTGTVSRVGETLWGMELGLQCIGASRTKDVTVSFDASSKPKLAQLATGQQVQFTGQLDDMSELGGIVVKQGELGTGRVTTPPEPSVASRAVSPPPATGLPSSPPASPPAPPRPLHGSSVSPAGLPAIKLGDTYIIESLYPENPKLSTTTERTVLSVSGGTITVASRNIKSKTAKARILQFTSEWNLLSSRNADGSGFDYAPPLKYFEFPLYPGKTWRQMSREIDIKTGAVREHMFSAVAGDWEDIAVPAGTFRAIKITTHTELLDRATEQKSTGTDISWYAPDIRRSVKSVITSRNFQGQEERQIISMIQYDLK